MYNPQRRSRDSTRLLVCHSDEDEDDSSESDFYDPLDGDTPAAASVPAPSPDSTSSTEDNSSAVPSPAPVPVPKTTPVPAPAPVPAPVPVDTFQVGDNILAREGRGWYLAHVCKVDPNHYGIYFPDDGKTKRVRRQDVRKYNGLPQPLRSSMVGKTFTYEGDEDIPRSVWKVRRVLQDSNEYVCVKLEGEGLINIDRFDIGYVLHTIRHEIEYERQFGL